MHKRRIYKAHPDCGWRTLRSRLPVRHRTQTGARSSRMYHTSDPVPVPRIKSGAGLSRAFGLDFLQTPPRDDALVLLLSLGSANTWCEDSHLTSYVPCLAHTSRITGREKRALFPARVHPVIGSCLFIWNARNVLLIYTPFLAIAAIQFFSEISSISTAMYPASIRKSRYSSGA